MASAKTEKSDIEAPPPANESTPLVSSSADVKPDEDEPPPLKDMKAESTKEKMVAAAAAVSCKYSNEGSV